MKTLTMQDIATLARVTRPAVSQWRKRSAVRGRSIPFPCPVGVVGGVERFDRDQVIGWLELTGRGNNHRDREFDAAALAVPDGVVFDDVALLLALAATSDIEFDGADHAALVDAAISSDPGDEVLLREIRGLQPSSDVLAFTAELMAVSFGTADAFRRLVAGRLGRVRGRRELTGEAVELVRSIVGAAVVHQGADEVALVPAGDFSLALMVAEDTARLLVPGDDDEARRIKRRAVIEQVHLDSVPRGRSITVASLVEVEPRGLLDRVDDIVLGLGEGDVAVILGAAREMTDALTGSLHAQRTDTLRVGNVVAALRLPRTLWREAHRMSLAVWVCCGGVRTQAVQVADIEGNDLSATADLAADIGAALTQSDARAFRHLRPREQSRIRSTGIVVPRGTVAQRLRSDDSADLADRVHTATLTTSVPGPTVDVLIAATPGRFRSQELSLAELLERQWLSVHSGNRLDPAHADSAGTVRVLPEEGIRFDPFDVAQRYPRAKRTEPGDVVFVEKPTPQAWIDAVGGALVASPARILRIAPAAPFGPHLLAALINTTARAGSDWRTWRVPEVRGDDGPRLEAVIAEIADYRREMQARVAAADDLTIALVEGVGAGAISLDVGATTAGIEATIHTAEP